MFTINPMPQQLPASLIAMLEKCEVATIGHVLHSGFVDREIRAVLPRSALPERPLPSAFRMRTRPRCTT